MTRILTALAFIGFTAAASAQSPQIINPKALFPEGPVMSGGRLIYAEYAGHVVTVWDGKNNAQLWKQDGCGPSAVVPMGADFGITSMIRASSW